MKMIRSEFNEKEMNRLFICFTLVHTHTMLNCTFLVSPVSSHFVFVCACVWLWKCYIRIPKNHRIALEIETNMVHVMDTKRFTTSKKIHSKIKKRTTSKRTDNRENCLCALYCILISSAISLLLLHCWMN